MNKRIKKKAKQALQREQERLAQELTQLTPEHFEEVIRVINQSFHEIGKVIACFVDGLAAFFKNLEVAIEETEQQRTQMAGQRTFRFPNHPAYNRFTKTRVNNQKSRQSARPFNFRQQTNRKYGHQTRR